MIRLDDALVPPPLQSTRLGMPQASPEAAMAPARALGDLAQGISAIAQPFQEHAARVQQMEDTRLSTLKQTAYEEGYAKHLQESQSIANPAERLKANTQWLADNRPDTSELSPPAAADLNARLDQTASHYRIQAGADAMRASQAGMVQAVSQRLQAKIAAGDRQGVTAVAQLARAQGVATESEARQMEEHGEKQIHVETLDQRLVHDPEGVIQELQQKGSDGIYKNDTPLAEPERARLLAKANLQVQALRGTDFQRALFLIDQGKATNGMLEQPGTRLTPEDRSALIAYNTHPDAPVSVDGPSRSWSTIENLHRQFLDPALPSAGYARTYNDAQAALLPTIPRNLRPTFQQTLDYLAPGNRESNPARLETVTPQDLEMAATFQLNRKLNSGAFGNIANGSDQEKANAQQQFLQNRASLISDIRSNRLTSLPDVGKSVDDISRNAAAAAFAKLSPTPSTIPVWQQPPWAGSAHPTSPDELRASAANKLNHLPTARP